MDNAKLLKNVKLCYLSLSKFQEWLNKNDLWKKDFTETKKQWKQALEANFSSFFIDTELLATKEDIVLLQVEDENVVEYLAKNYQLKEQLICQKLFGENKHFLLLTKKQWDFLNKDKESKEEVQENCLFLFKNEETIKNKLAEWLENLPKQ